MRSTYLAAFLPALLATPAWAQSSGPVATETILLDFQDDVTHEQIAAFEAKYGVKTHLNSAYSDAEELRLTELLTPREEVSLLSAMQKDPLLEHAEPLATYTLPEEGATEIVSETTSFSDKFPNDPMYKHQWH